MSTAFAPTELWLEKYLQTARGKGDPLDSTTRLILELFFERDLSAVRIHHNVLAHQLTQRVHALAFTTGTDIFFSFGMYQPQTTSGLSLLTHEVTHVIQQATLDIVTPGTIQIGDTDDLFEQEAQANARYMLANSSTLRKTASNEQKRLLLQGYMRHLPDWRSNDAAGILIQRGIGMEIEIPVPIDKLSPAQLAQIQGYVAANQTGNAMGAAQLNGRVPYGIIQPAANGFRVDADHDNRVKTNPATPPLREGGFDSIMEIVTQPPVATAAAFNAAMNNVQGFINQINLLTTNLTTRWPNAFIAVPFAPAGVPPFVTNVSVGPMDFTAQGFPLAAHMPQHNFQGSIQVNIDIDLREYPSLLKWYANSAYAQAANAPANEQPLYTQIKDDIRAVVDAGRTITQNISGTQTAAQVQQAGNFRGLRGWITHLALYLKRGMLGPGVLGGTTKNLVPILIKSPNSIITTYGLTVYELNYFTNNRRATLDLILQQIGRPALVVGQLLSAIDVFAATPGILNLDDLSNPARAVVPLAGTPVMVPPNLGPHRTGNASVQAIPDVPGMVNTRGGLVAEFRSFPGFYDGLASWRALGLDFLQQAATRNARNGIVH